MKPLQKLHERAARVTRDGFWTRCYVRNLSPERAAELAAREYDSTHPAAWVNEAAVGCKGFGPAHEDAPTTGATEYLA